MQSNQHLLLKSIFASVIITSIILGVLIYVFATQMKEKIIEELREDASAQETVEPPGRSSPVKQLQGSDEY